MERSDRCETGRISSRLEQARAMTAESMWRAPFRMTPPGRLCMEGRALVNIGISLVVGLLIFDLAGFEVYPSPSFFRVELATPQSVSMQAAAWNILYSRSMPAHPQAINGGWYFDFPSCSGSNACSVHYVTMPVNLSASATVRAVFRIATTGAPVFYYKLQADNMCDYPAHVRYILQRRGDGLSVKSEFYRWFSSSGFQLEAGSADLTVSLRPEQWVSVFGKRGDYNESTRTEFHQALQDLGSVGFVFGGGCFYGHGVNVIGGSARFLATEYFVQ
jgi:hypothetical protein